MNEFTASDSRSLPRPAGTVTRASAGDESATAQPALTSGFGTLLEKEHVLQSAIEACFGQTSGSHSPDFDRILHHQHARLDAIIALLEQRYEALPKPERFVHWQHLALARPPPPPPQPEAAERLPELIAQHTRLLVDIEALIACAPDGQRGEIILTEVGRSHEEMAWMLTALQRDDESAVRTAGERSRAQSRGTDRAQERWDNEGGPARLDPSGS